VRRGRQPAAFKRLKESQFRAANENKEAGRGLARPGPSGWPTSSGRFSQADKGESQIGRRR